MDAYSVPGMVFKCSSGIEREKCPFNKIRSLQNLREQLIAWKALSDQEKIAAIEDHKNCVFNCFVAQHSNVLEKVKVK